MLPVAWALLAISAVGSFIAVAAYWLDVQDRPDFSFRSKVAWSLGTLLFPVMIPVYAFAGGPGWPRSLRIAAFLPIVALALIAGFVTGFFK